MPDSERDERQDMTEDEQRKRFEAWSLRETELHTLVSTDNGRTYSRYPVDAVKTAWLAWLESARQNSAVDVDGTEAKR